MHTMSASTDSEEKSQVGISFKQATLDRISGLLGYGNRSAFVQDIVEAGLEAHSIYKENGEYIPPHQLAERILESVRKDVEEQGND